MSNKTLPKFPTLWLKAQLLANSPGAWGPLRGRRLDRASCWLEHMFTRAVMSRLVQTEPRHRCILVRWHGVVLCCERCRGWGVELITCRQSQRGHCEGDRGPSPPQFLPLRRNPTGACRCAAWNKLHAWSCPETDWWNTRQVRWERETGEVERGHSGWRKQA